MITKNMIIKFLDTRQDATKQNFFKFLEENDPFFMPELIDEDYKMLLNHIQNEQDKVVNRKINYNNKPVAWSNSSGLKKDEIVKSVKDNVTFKNKPIKFDLDKTLDYNIVTTNPQKIFNFGDLNIKTSAYINGKYFIFFNSDSDEDTGVFLDSLDLALIVMDYTKYKDASAKLQEATHNMDFIDRKIEKTKRDLAATRSQLESKDIPAALTKMLKPNIITAIEEIELAAIQTQQKTLKGESFFFISVTSLNAKINAKNSQILLFFLTLIGYLKRVRSEDVGESYLRKLNAKNRRNVNMFVINKNFKTEDACIAWEDWKNSGLTQRTIRQDAVASSPTLTKYYNNIYDGYIE